MYIAIDIGGTFTDMVVLDNNGTIKTWKGDTTPPNFEQGILNLLNKSNIQLSEVETFIHGTTTIINALTERKGAKTALITTKGFRDILEIARCNRPDLFNLVFKKPTPFIPRYLRCEVEERLDEDGNVLMPLNEQDIEKAVAYLKAENVESIAVCFVNSYMNDFHEKETVAKIKELWPSVFVSSSSDVTREWREYERTSTVALNAYVGPTASKYLDKLDNELTRAGLNSKKYIMQSNGGTSTFEQAKIAPINMVESGPVAGVFGAAVLGKVIGEKNIIAFDVGGTTAKCSLIDNGEVKIVTDYRIERTNKSAGYPLMAPVVDIVEIGNGGGSIAWVDETGSLCVGPQSAGSLPGPVAYGKGGEEPTTTDACLLTGRLSPSNFEHSVNMDTIEEIFANKISTQIEGTAKDSAVSVIRVAEANMYNALKLISVRRGYDPRDFTLVAFGGGGAMHATGLAKELFIKKVVVPVAAPVFSALGMLMTDVRKDYIQTKIQLLSESSPDILNNLWTELLESAQQDFSAQGFSQDNLLYTFYADMRYLGQEHTVKIPVPALPWKQENLEQIIEQFHQMHEHAYTFKLPDSPVEIVNLHLAVIGKTKKPELFKQWRTGGKIKDAYLTTRSVYFTSEGFKDTPIYDREKLSVGNQIVGPAVVEEKANVTLVYEGQTLIVDEYGNLLIELEEIK